MKLLQLEPWKNPCPERHLSRVSFPSAFVRSALESWFRECYRAKRSEARRAQREWHKGARCGCRRFYLSPRAMHRVCTTDGQRLASLSSRSLRILALLWYADDVAKFSSAPALISSILRESTVTTPTNLFLSLYGDADNDSLSKAQPDNDTFDCTRVFH